MADRGLAIIEAQLRRTVRRKAAVKLKAKREGYKYINIILIREDKYQNTGISGIDVYDGYEYNNPDTGRPDYFCQLKSGFLTFDLDQDGTLRQEILDTDNNRQFLAAHYDRGYWEIGDKEVEADIRKRAYKIRDEVIANNRKALEVRKGWFDKSNNDSQKHALSNELENIQEAIDELEGIQLEENPKWKFEERTELPTEDKKTEPKKTRPRQAKRRTPTKAAEKKKKGFFSNLMGEVKDQNKVVETKEELPLEPVKEPAPFIDENEQTTPLGVLKP